VLVVKRSETTPDWIVSPASTAVGGFGNDDGTTAGHWAGGVLTEGQLSTGAEVGTRAGAAAGWVAGLELPQPTASRTAQPTSPAPMRITRC
jgi:hypothetical protein